jgi:hypothetical protein
VIEVFFIIHVTDILNPVPNPISNSIPNSTVTNPVSSVVYSTVPSRESSVAASAVSNTASSIDEIIPDTLSVIDDTVASAMASIAAANTIANPNPNATASTIDPSDTIVSTPLAPTVTPALDLGEPVGLIIPTPLEPVGLIIPTQESVGSIIQPQEGLALTPPITSTPISRPSHQTIPGERYRNTPAYLALNLSLTHAGGEGVGGSGGIGDRRLSQTRSLRTGNSFPLVTSSSRTLYRTPNSCDQIEDRLSDSHTERAQRLLAFVSTHKGVLNLLVRAKPALLEGSFSALIRVTQLRSFLDFSSKRRFFFSQLNKMRSERGRRSVHLQLRRGQVFEDSFHQLRMRSSEEMR